MRNKNDVGGLSYKNTQGKSVQNIQGFHNGLQTHGHWNQPQFQTMGMLVKTDKMFETVFDQKVTWHFLVTKYDPKKKKWKKTQKYVPKKFKKKKLKGTQ